MAWLSPWDPTLRQAWKNRVKDVLWNPGRILDSVYTQSIGIIQAPDLLPDFAHPSPEGAGLLAQAVEPLLSELLGDHMVQNTVVKNTAIIPVGKLEDIPVGKPTPFSFTRVQVNGWERWELPSVLES